MDEKKIEERAKNAIKLFESQKEAAGFGNKELLELDEKEFRTFANKVTKKKYEMMAVFGAEDNQLVCVNGNKGALIYALAKALMTDHDLLDIVDNALGIVASMQKYVRYGERSDKAN